MIKQGYTCVEQMNELTLVTELIGESEPQRAMVGVFGQGCSADGFSRCLGAQ